VLAFAPKHLALGAVPLLALGCSANAGSFTVDADTGSTHGLITVERTTSGSEPARAAAFAAFVRTPPEVDPATVMRLAGLGLELPAVGQCTEMSRERDPSTTLPSLARIEFLNAGDVQVSTAETSATLAPRAFPAVFDLISGVVYTTRDRSAEPLPAATRYALAAAGGVLGSFSVVADAPAPPESVRVSGVALSELSTLSVRAGLALEWQAGSAQDTIYAELSTSDGSSTLRCTLADNGVGSIPAALFQGAGPGQLALHRLRSVPFASPAVDAGLVRFDFQTAQAVSFAQ
jgi:hypothetical protein